MKVETFSSFIFEKKDTLDLKQRLSDDYKSIKEDIIDLINDTVGDNKTVIDIENFLKDYISSGKDSNTINGLIDDNDIFNFYLSNQSDIDKYLNDSKYMDESPKSHNVHSLYDVIIDGTKQSILDFIIIINKEVFKKS